MPPSPRRKISRWPAAAAGAGALLAVFLYAAARWPNDARIPFETWRESPPPRRAAYDFLRRALEARYAGPTPRDKFAEALVGQPAVNAHPFFNRLAGVVQVSLGRPPGRVARRAALYAPADSSYEFTLFLPPAAPLLTFSYGLLPQDKRASLTQFSVELIGEDGQAVPVFSDQIKPDASRGLRSSGWLYRWLVAPWDVKARSRGPRWRQAAVDLKGHQGKTVRLRFRTSWKAKPKQKPPHGFWGQPVLWTKETAAAPRPDNLILIVADTLRWDLLGTHGAQRPLTPHLDMLARESVDFSRVTTNAVWPRLALPVVLGSRLPSQWGPAVGPASPSVADKDLFYRADWPTLAKELKTRGYRTAAFGDLRGVTDGPVGVDWGFDEAHMFERAGYEAPQALAAAAKWISQAPSGEPFFVLIHLKDGAAPAPWRDWLRAVPGQPSRIPWRARANAAYLDRSLGRFFKVLEGHPALARALVSFVSVRGAGYGVFPVLSDDGEPSRRPMPLPMGFTEGDLRVVWTLKHHTLRPGLPVTRPAQLLDVAPTLLNILNLPLPATFDGAALAGARPSRVTPAEDIPNVVVHGWQGKALVSEGHFKYIRRFRAPRVKSGVWPFRRQWRAHLAPEELYDVWEDPSETRNLARRDRNLLYRMRRLMDASDPDPMETRLLFWDLQGTSASGGVRTPVGQVLSSQGTVNFGGRSSMETNFHVQGSSGEARVVVWPPSVSHIVQMRLNQKFVAPEQTRVSKFGVPLFDRKGVDWWDPSMFPWLEGFSAPLPGEKGPLVFMGRVPAYNLARPHPPRVLLRKPELPPEPLPETAPPAVATPPVVSTAPAGVAPSQAPTNFVPPVKSTAPPVTPAPAAPVAPAVPSAPATPSTAPAQGAQP